MYIPKPFAASDSEALEAVIRDNPFGLLIGPGDGAPVATHLPFLLDGGRLVAHMARGNPHWRRFAGGAGALAVFSGPHAYISPRWYAAAPAVPTWNYVAVHVYGTPQIIDDAGEARDVLDRMTAEYEDGAWTLAGQGEDYAGRQMRGIVAFEIPVARMEGKFKLSQNRSAEDRAGVIAALRESDRPEDAAVARLMDAD